jgi:hypothetical protein
MKDVDRVMWGVFLTPPKAGVSYEMIFGLTPPSDYVDALGEPIDPAQLDRYVIMRSPEEAWGVEATRVAQSRIAQARRFREWALQS